MQCPQVPEVTLSSVELLYSQKYICFQPEKRLSLAQHACHSSLDFLVSLLTVLPSCYTGRFATTIFSAVQGRFLMYVIRDEFSARGQANRVLGWCCARYWRQTCYTKQLEQNSWFGVASFWSWSKSCNANTAQKLKSSVKPCYTASTFSVTLLHQKSSLQIVPCNITFSDF